jgi:hypothetical protein
MWEKITKELVCNREGGCTHIFDESNLRASLRSYLSDESRSRYGGENFSTDKCFINGIQWHLDGLKCLLISLDGKAKQD